MRRIPTSTDPKVPSYTQRTQLGSRDYLLTFDWNGRDGHWYLDIALEDETMVAAGIKIVLGTRLLRSVYGPNRPEGEIIAVDTTGSHRDPGLEDLGSRVILAYLEPSDLAGGA